MDPFIIRGLRVSTRNQCSAMNRTPFFMSRAQSTMTKAKRQPTTPKSSAQTSTPKATLSWPEYLEIRRNKRTWQTVATIPCALLGFMGGAAYFGNLDTDPLKPVMGIDPFFFYGFCTMGCVGFGALIGPTLGASIWRFRNRNILDLIDRRDTEFFQRIAKNRVDPTLQSPTQPVPDYYGEKIGSLAQYRQWLRDQNKYKRKALLPEE
ncbi:mitochondrial import protein Pam17-domain-containing protein [Gymnopilus junonius]|uniref:Presequence translocated-associated motor subunit PAM17 n=1 Tax=Gymnopilus junonius TaxID=109634 RepID=A0A9P5P198_GYMJU|nr:mitochondrial import protein Pam17-domain-containing protein [Gymnopilus junonius]